jgi:hypothetical protein
LEVFMANGCPCSGNENAVPSTMDWNGLHHMTPGNPLDVIAYAQLGPNIGSYLDSMVYNTDANWEMTQFKINAVPTVTALGTDDLQKVADANQWNFANLTWDNSNLIAYPLRTVIFLRGGNQWINTIPINFGANTYNSAQLSYLFNAASIGCQCVSKIPVINLGDNLTGIVNLQLVFSKFGTYMLGLRTTRTGPLSNMFSMICVVRP